MGHSEKVFYTSGVESMLERSGSLGVFVLCLCIAGMMLTGCGTDADETALACINQGPQLAAQCAPGSNWGLLAQAAEQCGLNGVYQPLSGEATAGGQCLSSGSCSFTCTIQANLCPCGVSEITSDKFTCTQCPGDPCTAGDTQCRNGQISTCLSDGTWSDATDCASGEICQNVNGSFACAAGTAFVFVGESSAGEGEGSGGVDPGGDAPTGGSMSGEVCFNTCEEAAMSSMAGDACGSITLCDGAQECMICGDTSMMCVINEGVGTCEMGG